MSCAFSSGGPPLCTLEAVWKRGTAIHQIESENIVVRVFRTPRKRAESEIIQLKRSIFSTHSVEVSCTEPPQNTQCLIRFHVVELIISFAQGMKYYRNFIEDRVLCEKKFISIIHDNIPKGGC